jgi:hypothetical protein
MIEAQFPGLGFQDKSLGGTDGNTGSTMSAFGFVTDDILAQGLDLYPSLLEVFDALVVVLSLTTQLQNQQPLLSWGYGSPNDIEGETKIPDQPTNDRLARHIGWKVEHYSSRYIHLS